jgi:hypothetical protein
VRIATLGNSTVLGLELSEAETIPAQLAARLSERNPACSFDYVSVSGPGYDHSDLMWLMAHVVDAADFDHVVIIHAGPGHDAARTADWPFLERFRLYWEWQNSLQRQIRENGGRTAAARTASLIERERSALEQIVQSAPGADIWYHTFTGFEHDRQDNLRSLWRSAAAETLSRRDNTGFSTSLDDIPPTQDYFLSPYHYTPKGAAMAAGLIADNIFEVYPEQNALCR